MGRDRRQRGAIRVTSPTAQVPKLSDPFTRQPRVNGAPALPSAKAARPSRRQSLVFSPTKCMPEGLEPPDTRDYDSRERTATPLARVLAPSPSLRCACDRPVLAHAWADSIHAREGRPLRAASVGSPGGHAPLPSPWPSAPAPRCLRPSQGGAKRLPSSCCVVATSWCAAVPLVDVPVSQGLPPLARPD